MDKKGMIFLGFINSSKGNKYEAFCFPDDSLEGVVFSENGAVKFESDRYYVKRKKDSYWVYKGDIVDSITPSDDLLLTTKIRLKNLSLLTHIAQGFTEKTPQKPIKDELDNSHIEPINFKHK